MTAGDARGIRAPVCRDVTVAGFFFNTGPTAGKRRIPPRQTGLATGTAGDRRELTWHPREEPSAGLWVSVLAAVGFAGFGCHLVGNDPVVSFSAAELWNFSSG